MFPFRDLFIHYTPTPGSYVILANKSRVSCTGSGTVRFSLRGKAIILHDVLHVPKLRSPLLSVRCFWRLVGCSFLANNTGSFLTFPTFILNIEDSSDCTIPGHSSFSTQPHFDSRQAGSIAAISDNTRFRNNRRPVILPKPAKDPEPQAPTSCSLAPVDDTSSSLSIDGHSQQSGDPIHLPHDRSILRDLHLDLPPASSSPLSPTQVCEITTTVAQHLEKHRKITLDLINLLRDRYPPSSIPTSSTPICCPSQLSSDKMSSAAPTNMHFTVQQLSRYFGFRSLKNWDVLHDVCQSNFSLVNASTPPLELGQVANIKKACSNKVPIECPAGFLEVVHCDIGFGDIESIGNGASYCMVFVDRATRYTWIYPLKSLHHESIKAVLSAWRVDTGLFPARLYTDFDPKILEGPTASYLPENKVSL
jgi:hypothetical protein